MEAVDTRPSRFLCVCGARPNFVKIAPILELLRADDRDGAFLVHTGQHYDDRMNRLFFEELGIPKPDINLDVGSGSHAYQTGEIMKRFEPVCARVRPDWVIVVGDVNGTMAAALTATKLGVPVAHVEAGLRSFDRTMPEEINRIVTDHVSDALFVTEPSGVKNLRDEGIPPERIYLVGNVMVDTLMRHRAAAERSMIRLSLAVGDNQYALVTLHRPGNVDRADTLSTIFRALEEIAGDLPVVLPLHPRTMSNLDRFGLLAHARQIGGLHLLEPLGYLDFLNLMSNATVVLTDSGGIQEETTVLGVPCLTLRENTERPITLTQGTNRLVGTTTERILQAYFEIRSDPPPPGRVPDLWDGHAAERIVARLRNDSPTGRPTLQPAAGAAP